MPYNIMSKLTLYKVNTISRIISTIYKLETTAPVIKDGNTQRYRVTEVSALPV